MKRLLSLTLLLASASVMAQETSSKGCRVLIGEDWIPMGATTVSGCLKYAEAAATPGDRQFAQFDGVQLSYKDGQSSQSTDGGKTWQPVRSSSQGSVGTLNTLRGGGDQAPPAAGLGTASAAQAAKPTPDARSPSRATATSAAMPELEAPIPLDDTAPAAPAGSRNAQMAPSAPARRYHPQTPALTTNAPAVVGRSGGLAESDSYPSGIPRGCQVHIGNNWQVIPATSAAACGRLLISAAEKSGAKSSQAYWAGTYLFYSGNQLYQSTDGSSWTQLK